MEEAVRAKPELSKLRREITGMEILLLCIGVESPERPA
jgi:hypothetical protein